MYVTSEKMLLDAQKGGYAIGAFNFENMEMCMAIIAAAEELRAPVILQTTPSTVKYAGIEMFRSVAFTLASRATVPVALHLDHGDSFSLALNAMAGGYSSVMIDGSHSPFEQNIALTKSVVDVASAKNIPVEAELGKVGGKEDDLDGGKGGYTDPSDALEFVKQTGISSLAVAIGTAHGVYQGEPILDVERLKEIRKTLRDGGHDIPLVLHGASGLSEAAVKACIAEGICKVNFATELRQAYTAATRNVLTDEAVFDPKKFGKAGIAAVIDAVKTRILVCGCNGKA